jgi:hypothetical protein
MSKLLLQAAEVLEKAAALIDAQEAEKTAAVKNERTAAVKLLSAKFAEATGEGLSEDMIAKLAASNDDLITTVQHMIEKTAGAVESMGRPSGAREESAAPRNKKEAANASWDRFGSFLTS